MTNTNDLTEAGVDLPQSCSAICSERHNPRWISMKRQKPRQQDSCDGWVIFISADGQLYFNFWSYGWDAQYQIVAWSPIPFWAGQGLAKQNAKISPVEANDVQRRIMDNPEIQDALIHLEFVIGAEMGRVKYVSANVDFEDGATASLWITPNAKLSQEEGGKEQQ